MHYQVKGHTGWFHLIKDDGRTVLLFGFESPHTNARESRWVSRDKVIGLNGRPAYKSEGRKSDYFYLGAQADDLNGKTINRQYGLRRPYPKSGLIG